MKIEFTGLKKTNRDFMTKLKDNTPTLDSLKQKLKSLNIFSNIDVSSNKVSVIEERNKINLSSSITTGKPKNSLNILLPNIFGCADYFKMSLSSLKEYDFMVSKPFVFRCLNGNVVFLKYVNSVSLLKLPSERYTISKNEINMENNKMGVSAGIDKLDEYHQNYMKFNLRNVSKGRGYSAITNLFVKMGLCKYNFTKLELNNSICVDIVRQLSYNLRVGCGALLGAPPKHEKFYIGKNVKGYKNNSISPIDYNEKTGGLSFVEMTNKLLYKYVYVFSCFGYNSRQPSLMETCKTAYKNIRNVNSSCLGISVGTGLTIPLSKSDDGPALDASLSFPLTNNKNIERYQFGVNLDF